jgi:transcription termination factor NusB
MSAAGGDDMVSSVAKYMAGNAIALSFKLTSINSILFVLYQMIDKFKALRVLMIHARLGIEVQLICVEINTKLISVLGNGYANIIRVSKGNMASRDDDDRCVKIRETIEMTIEDTWEQHRFFIKHVMDNEEESNEKLPLQLRFVAITSFSIHRALRVLVYAIYNIENNRSKVSDKVAKFIAKTHRKQSANYKLALELDPENASTYTMYQNMFDNVNTLITVAMLDKMEFPTDLSVPITPPRSAYMLYNTDVRRRVAEENPCMTIGETGRLISAMWKNLPEEEKLKYNDREKFDVDRFNAETFYRSIPQANINTMLALHSVAAFATARINNKA